MQPPKLAAMGAISVQGLHQSYDCGLGKLVRLFLATFVEIWVWQVLDVQFWCVRLRQQLQLCLMAPGRSPLQLA